MTQQEFQKRYTYIAENDRLGGGGFGEVFKAYDTVRDRWVALKVSKVKPELENVRLRKEVEMVNRLPEHPNIAFYEVCYTFREMSGEYDFGILQYYEEGNLGQLLLNNTLTFVQKQSILTQVLEGIDFLHQNGVVHRDLKPQNILIARRGNEFIPKITDFGISKKLDAGINSVFSNSITGAGTLAYASPEQLRQHEISKNTDLWSFGVIAFQTFTGQLPFTTGPHANTSEEGRTELFRQIKSGRLPSEITKITEPWQTLIRRCLIPDAAVRIKNMQEVKDILTGNDSGKAHPHLPQPDKTTLETKHKTSPPLNNPETTNIAPKPPSPTLWNKIVPASIVLILALLAFFYYNYGKNPSGKVISEV